MQFQEVIKNRRSVRAFLPQTIEAEKIEFLKEAVLRSPTSRNRHPWNFIFVQNKETLEQLSMAKEHGSALLRNAPLAVVVCADDKISDVWIEDASIASTYLFLAAEELELGACWVQIRSRSNKDEKNSEQVVREILSLPDDFRVLSIIAMGYPEHKNSPIFKKNLIWSKISEIN